MPAIGDYITAKFFGDDATSNSVDEPILVRNNQNNAFNTFKLTNINSNTLTTQKVNGNQVITEANVDQFHQEN